MVVIYTASESRRESGQYHSDVTKEMEHTTDDGTWYLTLMHVRVSYLMMDAGAGIACRN